MDKTKLSRKLSLTMALAATSLALFAAIGCPKGEEAASVQVDGQVATAEFLVKNMTCTSCDQAIVAKLEELKGVSSASADFNRGYVAADYDPKLVSTAALVEEINGMGFESRLRQPGDVDIPPSPHGVPGSEAGE